MLYDDTELLAPVKDFLFCETPDEWVDMAARPEYLPILLVDHCNCELKAAQTAIWLMRKYAVEDSSAEALLQWVKPYEAYVYHKSGISTFPDKQAAMAQALNVKESIPFAREIVEKMVRLVKEELLHFEQVLGLIRSRDIKYQELSASRYARSLIKHVRTFEPATQIDKLIIGAYIEARSCERFAKLAPHLDDELKHFYTRLLKSEARHFRDYLSLAQRIAGEDISERVSYIGGVEAESICSVDKEFRFHSGKPSIS